MAGSEPNDWATATAKQVMTEIVPMADRGKAISAIASLFRAARLTGRVEGMDEAIRLIKSKGE